jgi:hypothetical protein
MTPDSLADDASSERRDFIAEGSGRLDPDGILAECSEDFTVFAHVES